MVNGHTALQNYLELLIEYVDLEYSSSHRTTYCKSMKKK